MNSLILTNNFFFDACVLHKEANLNVLSEKIKKNSKEYI